MTSLHLMHCLSILNIASLLSTLPEQADARRNPLHLSDAGSSKRSGCRGEVRATGAVGADRGCSVVGAPRKACFDHDRVRPQGRGCRNRCLLPGVPGGVAGDEHEPAALRALRGAREGRAEASRSRTGSASGRRSPRPCEAAPAAMFASATSSRTRIGPSTATSPEISSTRGRPPRRAPVGGAGIRRRDPAANGRDARRRLCEALLGQPARVHCLHDCGVHPGDCVLMQVVTEAERVGSGGKGAAPHPPPRPPSG